VAIQGAERNVKPLRGQGSARTPLRELIVLVQNPHLVGRGWLPLPKTQILCLGPSCSNLELWPFRPYIWATISRSPQSHQNDPPQIFGWLRAWTNTDLTMLILYWMSD